MPEALFYNAVAILHEGDHRKLAKLRERFGSWRDAWETLQKKTTDPQREWDRLAEHGVALVLRDDPAYPKLLREIPQAPFGLYVRGALPADAAVAVAIVGTRKATPGGATLAKQFAADLARRALVIVSGLAFGIDVASHEGCLAAGGKAIAVLANGLDEIRPKTNAWLGNNVLESGGAIISEYPFGTESLPYRFLERNRIVSGLARGTLVIEAPERSGSLATARFALDQNRDVFVIPGPITHPNFKGSHELIRAGAELVTKPEDILASFGIETEGVPGAMPVFASDEEKKIYAVIAAANGSADVDKIAELAHLQIPDINRTLTSLVMKHIVRETGAGYSIII